MRSKDALRLCLAATWFTDETLETHIYRRLALSEAKLNMITKALDDVGFRPSTQPTKRKLCQSIRATTYSEMSF